MAKKKNKAIEEILRLEDMYRTTKHDLNTMIRRAKAKSWQELIYDLDRDPWGLPYRVNKLRRSQPALTEILREEVLCNTINQLFPRDDRWMEESEVIAGAWQEDNAISEAEIFQIIKKKASSNKAPGMDGIKSIFLKKIPEVMLKRLTSILNIYMKVGVFPAI